MRRHRIDKYLDIRRPIATVATDHSGKSQSQDGRLLLLLHTFNGPLSGTTRMSRYQRGKTNLDFTEARESEWQWHQLGRMQVCTSLQTDNHASTPLLSFLQAGMPFLPPNQQRQSTEGNGRLPELLTAYSCLTSHSKAPSL